MTAGHPDLDLRGMACSDAVVRLHRSIMPLPAGSALTVRADDPEVMRDLRRYAERSGHAWGPESAAPGGATDVEVRRGG